MKHRISKILLVLTLLISSVANSLGQSTAEYNVIPVPQSVAYGQGNPFVLQDGVQIVCVSKDAQMQYNAEYLQSYLMKYCGLSCAISNNGKKAGNIVLKVSGKKNKTLADEGYTLNVTEKNVEICGNSPIGVFYGIQTLCQALDFNCSEALPAVTITDFPRFGYRGFMLDFSRHFFDKEFVERQIEAMSQYKLNRLHMHLTDAGGWRVEIKSHPELTQKTAYRTREDWRQWWDRSNDRQYVDEGTAGAYGGYFTQADIKEIIAFASKRGVTIVPEIEMPGHSQDVFFVHPELCCTGNFLKQGDVCIGNDAVFAFFEDVLREIAELFPSEYIHIGGDECAMNTWPDCPKCQKRMKDEGLQKVADLQTWFVEKIDAYVRSLGKKIIGWDEILEGELSQDAAVMSWRGEEGGIKAANSGHHVVMSPGDPLYLDCFQDSPLVTPDAQGRLNTLEKVYSYDPVGNVAPEVAKYIDGLQGNLWTERVSTKEHCEEMMWPRLMAIAEDGWSNKENKDYAEFKSRAVREVAKMQAEGYHPFDINNEYGDRRESVFPLKHLALGKKVTYNAPYSSAYVAAGDATLTDGLRGNWMHNDGRWQGFIGKNCLDVVVDLGEITKIQSVYADFMQEPVPQIYYPADIEISISDDGKDYKVIKNLHYNVDPDERYGILDFGWHGSAEARYIRYKADTSSFGGWLFTDEIVVE